MPKIVLIKPKTLFLIDALGAGLTAFNLFVVLRSFQAYIGMPEQTLTYLSAAGVLFCCYSAACLILIKKRWKPYLCIIATANLLYCILTAVLIGHYFQSLSTIGISYFVFEITVILILVFFEFRTLKYWSIYE